LRSAPVFRQRRAELGRHRRGPPAPGRRGLGGGRRPRVWRVPCLPVFRFAGSR